MEREDLIEELDQRKIDRFRENQEYRDIDRVFKERDAMRALEEMGYNEEYLDRLKNSRKASLEKSEKERIVKKEKRDFATKIVATILITATIVAVGTHMSKKPVDTYPSDSIIIESEGIYNGQGIQIFHSDKNWDIIDGKQVMIPEEMAMDLSKLSEINRKYALYDITKELKIGSILVNDFKSKENVKNVDKIVRELSKLVGKTDTNYLNVEDLNDVVIRYGYTNYSEFSKACQSQLDHYNSIEESEEISKGVGK